MSETTIDRDRRDAELRLAYSNRRAIPRRRRSADSEATRRVLAQIACSAQEFAAEATSMTTIAVRPRVAALVPDLDRLEHLSPLTFAAVHRFVRRELDGEAAGATPAASLVLSPSLADLTRQLRTLETSHPTAFVTVRMYVAEKLQTGAGDFIDA